MYGNARTAYERIREAHSSLRERVLVRLPETILELFYLGRPQLNDIERETLATAIKNLAMASRLTTEVYAVDSLEGQADANLLQTGHDTRKLREDITRFVTEFPHRAHAMPGRSYTQVVTQP